MEEILIQKATTMPGVPQEQGDGGPSAATALANIVHRNLPTMERAKEVSSSRMRLLVDCLHSLDRDVRVDLRRRKTGVTEKRLNAAKIGPVVE